MNAPSPLVVHVHTDRPQATVVTAAGELDHDSADALRTTLLGAIENGNLVLDTSQLTFCDSSGLRTIIEANRLAQTHGHTLRLAATSPSVLRVLDITGFLTVLDLYPDVDTALKGSSLPASH